MALPNSGPLSSSMVRTEMSQSDAVNYTFTEWGAGSWGSGSYYGYGGNNLCAPINIYSGDGTYFTGSIYTAMSMSNWYSYNHTNALSLGTTSILKRIVTDHCTPSSMVIYDAGTTNTILTIEISGSSDLTYNTGPGLVVYYGKPWSNLGNSTGSVDRITGSRLDWDVSSGIIDNVSMSFDYNYTYDSNKGRYIYIVLYCDNCYAP